MASDQVVFKSFLSHFCCYLECETGAGPLQLHKEPHLLENVGDQLIPLLCIKIMSPQGLPFHYRILQNARGNDNCTQQESA